MMSNTVSALNKDEDSELQQLEIDPDLWRKQRIEDEL